MLQALLMSLHIASAQPAIVTEQPIIQPVETKAIKPGTGGGWGNPPKK